MKPQAKKIRHKLNVSSDSTDYLLGLVTAEADYKISLLLNNSLNISLSSIEPVLQVNKQNREEIFTRFCYSPDYNDTLYYLISNRADHLPLNKKFTNIDYFFFLKNVLGDSEIGETVRKIRLIKEVTGVFQLDYDHQLEEKVLL